MGAGERRVRIMAEVLIRLRVEQLPEGMFLATSDDVPGLVAQGRTVAEAVEIAQDVARKIVESYREHGDPLPPALWFRSYALPVLSSTATPRPRGRPRTQRLVRTTGQPPHGAPGRSAWSMTPSLSG